VAERVQVPDGQPCAADVVRRDEARVVADDVDVDGDHGEPRAHQLLDLGVVPVDAHDDDAVDAELPRPPVYECGRPLARAGCSVAKRRRS
jgi:hypothetical protein